MVPELIRGGTQHTAHSFFEIGRAEFELFLKERTNWYFKNYIDGMDGLLGLPFLPSLLLGLTSNYFKRVRVLGLPFPIKPITRLRLSIQLRSNSLI